MNKIKIELSINSGIENGEIIFQTNSHYITDNMNKARLYMCLSLDEDDIKYYLF